MLAVTGVLIIASTALLFTVAVLTARRPNPPAWILNELSMDLIAIAFTGGLALGTAIIFRYLSEFDSGILGAAEGGMILVILAGVVVNRKSTRLNSSH